MIDLHILISEFLPTLHPDGDVSTNAGKEQSTFIIIFKNMTML